MDNLEYDYDKILLDLVDGYTLNVSTNSNKILYYLLAEELQLAENISCQVCLIYNIPSEFSFGLFVVTSDGRKYNLYIDQDGNTMIDQFT